MSLVNQMLKDLEQRRAQLPAGDSLRGLHSAPVAPASARRWPLLALVAAVTGSGFGVWYARAPVALPTEAAQQPLAAAQAAPMPILAAAAIRTEVAPGKGAVPRKDDARATDSERNAAEYESAVDSEWDRDWLAEMNSAVSVASLEEHLTNEAPMANDEPQPQPPKAKTPERPAPRPAGSATTALAAAGSMHKTPREADPQTAAAQHYAGAVRLLKDGDRAGAESALRAALDAHPGDHAATQALAALLIQQGRRGEAETALADALTHQRGQPALTMLRARLLAEDGRDRDAVALLTPLQDAESQALLGALHQRLGNDSEAASAYRRALANAPREGRWWLGLAISLERTQQRAAALEAYRRASTDRRLDAQVNGYVRTRIAALGDGRG